jgi:hypothetical protein
MTWLLYLYPPRWRQRYGREFLALIASQRFSLLTVFDIIGGAIDAWTQPQSHLAARAATHPEGDRLMLARMMRLRCTGHGQTPTKADSMKQAAMILGGSLLSVVVATWMQRRSFNPEYAEALMANGWLIAFVVSMPFTTTKGWPMRTQCIFIGGLLAVLLAIAWINIG